MTRPSIRLVPVSLLACVVALAPFAVSGQTYFRAPPEMPRNAFSIGLRFTSPVDISFSNLGTVPFVPIDRLIDGVPIGRTYNDGHVRMDSSFVAREGSDGQIFDNPDGLTVNFRIASQSQFSGTDVVMTQYASVSEGFAAETDSGFTGGWELQYVRDLGRKSRFGILAGFNFSSFDSSTSSAFRATLLSRSDRFAFDDLPLPSFPGASGYTGPRDRIVPVGGAVSDLEFKAPLDPTGPTVEGPTLPGAADGFGSWKMKTAAYNFRSGPVYDFDLGKSFNVQVGLGVAATYFAGEFAINEAISGPTGEPTVLIDSRSNSKWLLGGYVDATANYSVSERVSVFSGLQYQVGATDYESSLGDREVKIDMSSTIHLRAGVGFRF